MSVLSKVHKTSNLKKEQTIQKNWYLVDASGKTLGRLCSEIAKRLRGKNKPTYTPNQDCGDGIIVINAAKIHISGNKRKNKIYYHHSRYPGGLKETTFEEMIAKHPEKVILEAVKGMLPKNKLGDKMLTHLRVFAGEKHTHNAQKPTPLNL